MSLEKSISMFRTPAECYVSKVLTCVIIIYTVSEERGYKPRCEGGGFRAF